jgi:diguanylate cyclase (GGDEF)-like protein
MWVAEPCAGWPRFYEPIAGRSIRQRDTGGDEFAVVLPETTSTQAQEIAIRIRGRIASDSESPPISVAVGSAVSPDDGDSIEKLLLAADRALYGMKRPLATPSSTLER